MATTSTVEITYPWPHLPGHRMATCTECGATEPGEGRIRHSKRCETRAQAPAAEQVAAPVVQATNDADLRTFASSVRRTGLTKGRDQDVLDAVRAGYLSESDAMNTDD